MKSDDKQTSQDILSSVIKTNDVARVLNFDLESSLDVLLTSAARAVCSEEASVLVKDDPDGNLVFMKVIGEVSDQLEGVEIPAGKGIAGFVAISGQPMAISDVGQEEAFYAEIDRKTGFSTEILLATPLIFDGDIIGVVEFVNRKGVPPFEPFTPEEMDIAAIYAEAIGALVNACQGSRIATSLAERICEGDAYENPAEISEWIRDLQGKDDHKDLLEIATLVKEIASRGSAHRKLCRELLESIVEFAGNGGDFDYSDV